MKIPRYIKIFFIFIFIFFSSFIILFFSGFFNNILPKETEGTYDLSLWDGENLLMNGKWEFYWHSFIYADSIPIEKEKMMVNVPSSWTSYKIDGKSLPSKGFGSFRFVFKNGDDKKKYGIRINGFATSYRLFINRKEIVTNGTPGKNKQNTIAMIKIRTVPFYTENGEADIIINVANYHHRIAGFWEPIMFGYFNAINSYSTQNRIFDILITGILIYIIMSYFFLFITNRSMIEYLYFILMNIFFLIRILLSGEQLLCDIIPIFYSNFEYFRKFFSITSILGIVFFILLFSRMYNIKNRYMNILLISSMIFFSIMIALLPIYCAYLFVMLNNFPTVALIIMVIIISIRGVVRNKQFSIIYLIGSIFLGLTVLHDMLFSLVVIPSVTFMSQYGLVFFVLCQAFIFALRHQLIYQSNMTLTANLKEKNSELQKRIIWKNHANRLLRRMSKKLISKDGRE